MSQTQPTEQLDLSRLTHNELLDIDVNKLTAAEALEWEWCEYVAKCKSMTKRYEQPWYDSQCGVSANNLKQLNCAENLNELLPEIDDAYRFGSLIEPCLGAYVDAQVRPVFRNIEAALVEEITKHDVIVGCVAWLTSERILKALQGKQVQFIVQQEDWLCTNLDGLAMRKQRTLYNRLTGISNCIARASMDDYFEVSPIRLSGKAKNTTSNNARMHHKFILFGSFNSSYVIADSWHRDTDFEFDLAWTGSYNLTANASRSLENGLFIKSPEVIKAYYQEWRQVLASSTRIHDVWPDSQYLWAHSYDEDLCIHFSDSDLQGCLAGTVFAWNKDDQDLRDGT